LDKKTNKLDRILIIKGVNVCGVKKSHDMLLVLSKGNKIYVVDPTIWQFFPRAKSILMLIENKMDIVLDKVKEIYKGKWKITEEFVKFNKNEEKEYLRIISQNIKENLK